MNARPPDGSDEPEAVDPVMLAVLSNRGRDATGLSHDQVRLVDDWVAGRLVADDAERAAVLVRQNTLAAERVLERRLQAAASQSPPVPQQLTARILVASAPSKVSAIGAWWRSLGRRQWAGIAGAAALASIVVVAGMPVLQRMLSGFSPLQVAMVTIENRNPLFEASDLRMRGTPAPPGPVVGERFRDIEVPTALLKDLVAVTGPPRSAAPKEIERYVLGTGESADRPVRLIVDAALRQSIDTADRDRMLVRVYDLNDPRSTDIRALVGLPPGNERAYFITVRP